MTASGSQHFALCSRLSLRSRWDTGGRAVYFRVLYSWCARSLLGKRAGDRVTYGILSLCIEAARPFGLNYPRLETNEMPVL